MAVIVIINCNRGGVISRGVVKFESWVGLCLNLFFAMRDKAIYRAAVWHPQIEKAEVSGGINLPRGARNIPMA